MWNRNFSCKTVIAKNLNVMLCVRWVYICCDDNMLRRQLSLIQYTAVSLDVQTRRIAWFGWLTGCFQFLSQVKYLKLLNCFSKNILKRRRRTKFLFFNFQTCDSACWYHNFETVVTASLFKWTHQYMCVDLMF